MKKIICFGEALIDFLNTGQSNQDGLQINNFQQFPGGAPANVAVAVAKLGGEAHFMGQVGDDQFGDFIISSLTAYGVDTSFTLQTTKAKTALAFVFLDHQGERSFLFHREKSADLTLNAEQLKPQWFEQTAILHFCSNTLTDSHIYKVTEYAVEQAIQASALISFDVNLRHNLWASGKADIAKVNSMLDKADVIKFSREELVYLSQGQKQSFIENLLSKRTQLVLVTNGGEPLEYFTAEYSSVIAVPAVDVVDTTAGGDGFVGGLLYKLADVQDIKSSLANKLSLDSLIKFAINCGAIAVNRAGAYPALATLDEVNQLERSY